MKRILSSLLVACLLLWLSAGRAEEAPGLTSMSRITLDAFSTVSRLQVYDDFSDPERVAAFEALWEDVLALLRRLDAAFSLRHADSDISRFNRLPAGQSTEVSPDTEALLNLAGKAFALTGGLFDPTVGPLVDLFGFTPRFSDRIGASMPYDRPMSGGVMPLPDPGTVESLRALVGFPSLAFGNGTLSKTMPAVSLGGADCQQMLDLGGIGKGYAVDCVMALLRERGYRYGFFSCGGSSIGILSRPEASIGAPEPGQWGLSVQFPRFRSSQEVLLRLFDRDRCFSVSGDYEHAYLVDGIRYSHLIDPRTGWPACAPEEGVSSGVCSAAVFGDNAALCDAISTALCVMEPAQALAFMGREDMREMDYLMVFFSDLQDTCEIVTSLPPEKYVLLDSVRFQVASSLTEDGTVLYHGSLAAAEEVPSGDS